ncbi:hypothetical protein LTR27_004721 [Elasticomyces elasticus]|nr:hypothetical protein LTR27_004721 [Elasticomyces elasticus]
MDEMESYAYQPLDPEQKQIRLLELAPGGYHDPLLARLLLVFLDDMPVYNTISYVWGDPSKTSELVICGTRLSVPINTILALRRMRMEDGVRVVWIDSCRSVLGIFAVLGMVTEPSGIVTDYTKPIQAISQEATRLIFRDANNLSALDLVYHEEDLGNGCSWVCRFDRPYDDAVNPYDHVTSNLTPSWGLAPPTKLTEDSGDADTIVLEGFKSDNVLRTTPVCTADTDEYHSSFRQWLYHAAIELGDSVETEQETLAKIAQAITEDRHKEGDSATVEDMDAVTGYLSTLMRSKGVLEATAMDQEYNQSLYDLFDEAESHCNFVYVRWRRLFRTTSGRIGLGPKVARPGDIVAVVRGGKYPCVLTSHGEEYRFVGTAYVHAIMKGEAVDEAHAKGLEEQEFVIR